MKDQKDVHIKIPKALFESFYRAFPSTGERRIFLVECIKEGINYQTHKSNFVKMVVNKALTNIEKGD